MAKVKFQDREEKLLRELWELRDTVEKRKKKRKPKPGTDGWHHEERKRAEGIKNWLKSREMEIQEAARRPKGKPHNGGWDVKDRGRRFKLIQGGRLSQWGTHPRHWPKDEPKGGSASVMKWAASQVGRTENNNRAPWLDAWARHYVGSWMVGQPWCGLFCIAAWDHGAKKRLPQGTVYTPNIVSWARNGTYFKLVHSSQAKPGDLVVFNFPGGSGVADHVGLARGPARGGVIPTIEGNTSPGSGGSQANGGGVYKRSRPVGTIAAVARPK